MKLIVENIKRQLEEQVMPFWLSYIDSDHGGYYGLVNNNLEVEYGSDKNAVLMTRYLWAFSAVYPIVPDEKIFEAAVTGFNFIKNKMIDSINGGIYWSVQANGEPKNKIKHVYAQSFAIYALSEFYAISEISEALNLAIELYKQIEKEAFDPDIDGYHEELTQNWEPQKATIMGPKGKEKYYTTNTILHLLEAYTNLYKVYPDPNLLQRIDFLIDKFQKIIISGSGYCLTEFTSDWQSNSDVISFGHDIETSWLLYRTLEIIKQEDNSQIVNLLNKIVKNIKLNGLDENQIIINQSKKLKKTCIKPWWTLAESVIGFYDAFERTNNSRYLEIVEKHWIFIQLYMIDNQSGSEWLPYVNEKGELSKCMPRNIIDEWKGPYHTVRMYVELINRMSKQ